MNRFIFGVFLIIVALVLARIFENHPVKWCIVGGITGCAIIFIALSFFAYVPTGYTGILRTFGKVEDRTLTAGLQRILPYQDVVLMDNRTQKIDFTLSAFSSDIQQVDITGSLNFSINQETAMNLYKNVGKDYSDKIIVPRIAEDIKAVFARYTAENLIEKRTSLSSEAEAALREDLTLYGLNIDKLSITNIDFTDAFESAVEAKQVATQTKQKAQTEQEQKTMETQQSAERQRIKAQAEADVKKINAEAEAYEIETKAEAQANANLELAASITEELIDYTKANLWNGILPTTCVYGDGATPIINIPVQ